MLQVLLFGRVRDLRGLERKSPREASSDEDLCRHGAASFGERRMVSLRELLVIETVWASTLPAGCITAGVSSPAHV
jgi:hypothetical protein